MAEPRRLNLAELRDIIVDSGELAKGTQVFDANGLSNLSRFEGKLYAEAAGSGASPYKVTVILEEAVKGRCSCMAARTRPFCKHAAALVVAWARAPQAFVVSDTAPVGAPAESTTRKTVKRGSVDARELMGGGVAQTATLIRELAVTGVTSVARERIQQVRSLGDNLRESRLRRISARTLDLAAMLANGGLDAIEYTDLLADMLLTVRKLEKHLGGEPIEDRHTEELIGKTWRKPDRKPLADLDLLEYSYSSRWTSDNFLIYESRFVDLKSGAHYSEKVILPQMMAARSDPKKSYYRTVLRGAGGGVYPGFAPFRLDLEQPGYADQCLAADLERLVAVSLVGTGAALQAFQEHRKDVFAPHLLPVAVRMDVLLSSGSQLQAVDAEGNTLHLPADVALQERLGNVLRGARLRAVLGEVGLLRARPILTPAALVVEGPLGLALHPLGLLEENLLKAAKPVKSVAVRRPMGASSAASQSLQEVREELADCFVNGLAGLAPRIADPLVARLRDLSMEKQAELLAALVAKPDPADRVDDFVKLYQVLGIALTRLAGTSHVSWDEMERVPTYDSVFVARTEERLPPREVVKRVAAGSLNRFEAALQYSRHYESMPPQEIARQIFPTWADASAAPYVVRALSQQGGAAVGVARDVLQGRGTPRIARLTAVAVLQAVGDELAEALLNTLQRKDGDARVRWQAMQAMVTLGRGSAAVRSNVEWARDALARLEDQAREYTRDLLSGRDKHIREKAAEELARAGCVSATAALRMAFFGDVTETVRHAAAQALAQLADDSLAEHLVRMLADRERHDEDAKMAARALGSLGDARGLEALVAAYQEGWKPAVVAEALAAFGEAALQPLVHLVEAQPDMAKRQAVLGVLHAQPQLQPFLDDRLAAAAEDEAEWLRRAELYLKLLPPAAAKNFAQSLMLRLGEGEKGPRAALRKKVQQKLEKLTKA